MKGRSLVIGLLGGLVLLLAFVFWLGLSGGGKGTDRRPMSELAPSAISATSDAGASASSSALAEAQKTISDRGVRDEFRRRILEGWAKGEGVAATAARSGKFAAAKAGDGGGIDAAYIREILRTDLVPMVKQCYDELLASDPKAGGKLDVEFTIAGDESVGGIVESAELLDTSSLRDEKLTTCVRESVLTLAFRPPPQGGTVTVKVPVVFAPNEPDQ